MMGNRKWNKQTKYLYIVVYRRNILNIYIFVFNHAHDGTYYYHNTHIYVIILPLFRLTVKYNKIENNTKVT